MHPKELKIIDFTYDLPQNKIAAYPLAERDQSKLLIYKNGKIGVDTYKNIDDQLTSETLLIFNNTKVVEARILFTKETGSTIEIFCLEPSKEFTPVSIAMEATTQVEWYCLIGGAKKWKEGLLSKEILIEQQKIIFNAEKIANENGQYLIRFSWNNPAISFSELLAHIGNIPLPPYIERAATNEDKDRYQTTYAKEEGSVAAPTAGLHFSKEVFDQLALKNIHSNFVTLHVGAGTFMPVKAATIDEHVMHAEFIDVDASTIQHLMNLFQNNDPKTIVAIGTTSIRTLESLYWLGIQQYHVQKNNQTANASVLNLSQWEAYELDNSSISTADALNALVEAAMAENVVVTKTVTKTVKKVVAKQVPVATATATPTPEPVVSVPVPVETTTAAAEPAAKSGFNSKLIILIVVVGLALGLGITFVGRREPKRKIYR